MCLDEDAVKFPVEGKQTVKPSAVTHKTHD